jgi:signal transduction histidine kinase
MLVTVSSSGGRNGDRGVVYIFYLLNITTIVWWAGSVVFFRIANSENINFMVRSLYVSATLIASSFYYFSLIFPDFKQEYKGKLIKIIFINSILIFLILKTDTIIAGGVALESSDNKILFGPYSIIFIIYILYYFCSSFLRLLRKYFNYSKDNPKKFQVLYVFIGYTLSGVISFNTNLLLHSLGNFKYVWLGPASTILVALSITYAVTKHRLFNVKIITTEFFVFILWAFTLIKISAFENLGEFGVLIPLSFLLLSLTIGILLIKSVKKQAEQHEENKRLVLQLANANQQLKEVDDIKSKFVSLARHQMASPLTAINAYASLLNDKDVDLDKIGLKSLQGIIDRFIVIVKDFLAISQIENEEVKYSNDEVDLAQTLNDILCERKFIIDHHNINIEMDIGDEEYKIKGDTAKLNTAIANILENSIQYSKDSTVLIKLEKKNSKIVLTISDEGVRSLPEISSVLLKKFSPDPFEATIMGNGLGVYVSKRFIEAHGGTFEIKNDGGCQFVILLPQV